MSNHGRPRNPGSPFDLSALEDYQWINEGTATAAEDSNGTAKEDPTDTMHRDTKHIPPPPPPGAPPPPPPLAAFAQSSDAVIGQVTKIDPTAEKITIKHGPIKKFGMDEGMTMVFHVLDSQLLKKVKPGDKVRFVPDRTNGQFTVTQIDKAK